MQIYRKANQIRKKLLAVVAFALLLSVLAVPDMQAEADNMIIRLSDKNLSIGENLVVTVSVPAGISASVSVNYPTSLLTYVKSSEETSVNGGTVLLSVGEYGSHERGTETITFKAAASGNAGIAVASTRATDSDGNQVSVGAASTIVKINNQMVQNQKSADSSLTSLSVSNGTLSPAFSAQVFNYTLDVDNSVSSLDISASPKDAGARVEKVEGADSLAEGKNTVKITVRAEDGTTSTYTIEVNRAKAEETPVENTGETADDGEEAAAGDQTEAVRLKSEFGYITILSEADTSTLPEGYEPRTLSIPDKGDVTAYFCEENPNICLLFAKNHRGESAWYQYDIKERTYLRWYGQKLTAAVGGESSDENQLSKLESENRMIFWAFVMVAAVLLVIILILLLKKEKNGTRAGEEFIDLDEVAEERSEKEEEKQNVPERTAKAVTDEISEIQMPEDISMEQEEHETVEDELQKAPENTEEKKHRTAKKRWKKNKEKTDADEDDGLEFIDL